MRLGVSVCLLAAMVTSTLTVTGCASAHTTVPRVSGATVTIAALPSDGWRPGMPGMAALQVGTLTVGAGCASAAGPTLWPAGWTVRGSELLDSSGAVVGRDGQQVRLTGGNIPAPRSGPCGVTAGAEVWAVEGPVG